MAPTHSTGRPPNDSRPAALGSNSTCTWLGSRPTTSATAAVTPGDPLHQLPTRRAVALQHGDEHGAEVVIDATVLGVPAALQEAQAYPRAPGA